MDRGENALDATRTDQERQRRREKHASWRDARVPQQHPRAQSHEPLACKTITPCQTEVEDKRQISGKIKLSYNHRYALNMFKNLMRH
jgi:hypothetical protein